ncbi:unnamed protein product, partial [Nesidiocoris tenuis]
MHQGVLLKPAFHCCQSASFLCPPSILPSLGPTPGVAAPGARFPQGAPLAAANNRS